MIADLVCDLLEGIATAAVTDHLMVAVVHAEPSRFCIFDLESRVVHAAYVPAGKVVHVHRAHRLIIEPIDVVRLRPLCCVTRQWIVQ